MRCPDCGAKNLPHARECVACGVELDEEHDGHEGEPDDRLGRVLDGRYRVDDVLGEGSMGRVYAATQLDLDAEVAVKILHPHVAADPKVAKRFHREARTASRLTHPNALRVFDFGRADEGKLLYLVMELVDGPDLHELVDTEGPLTPRRIGSLVGGVLEALEEAHDAGIVHRDLKPENVLVATDHQGREHAKVCDFGLAKLVEAEGSAITVTGFVCGTPEYMAPEQARGEALDGRSDLYAIGCLLYLLLTGEVPFKTSSALGTITEHLTKPVEPPSRRAPDRHIPFALERVCLRALRKDRDARFASAAEMRAALDAAVVALGPLADRPLGSFTQDPTRPRAPTPWRTIAAFTALVAVATVAIVVARDPRGPDGSAPSRAATRDAGVSAGGGGAADADGADPEGADPEDVDTEGVDTEGVDPEGVDTEGVDTEGADTEGAERLIARDVLDERDAGAGPGPELRDAGRRRVAQDAGARAAEGAAERAQTLFEEGRQRFLVNDVAGAITKFEAAARLRPRDAEIQKQLGRAYMRAGDVDAARRAYRRYLELAPNASDRSFIERILAGG
ncbi:MAG: protein kinase [Myxococcales bacterium]|nr:protein kinase [Myxococcales bacterium]